MPPPLFKNTLSQIRRVTMSAVASQVTKSRSGILNVFRGSPIMGPLLALVIAVIFFATQSDRFLRGDNLSLIMQQTVVVGVLAIGQTW